MQARSLRGVPTLANETQEREFTLLLRELDEVADQLTRHTSEVVGLMQRIVGVNEPAVPEQGGTQSGSSSAKEKLSAFKFRLTEQEERLRNALNAINQYI